MRYTFEEEMAETYNISEKNIIANEYIRLYRETGDKNFKDKAWDIISIELKKFVYAHFKVSPETREDIFQHLSLIVNVAMNNGGAFNPSIGVGIITYLKQTLISSGSALIVSSGTTVKFDVKRRRQIIRAIEELQKENPKLNQEELIELYVRQHFKAIDEAKVRVKKHEIYNLITANDTDVSLDSPIDEEGTPLVDLISDNSDFTEKVEQSSSCSLVLKVAKEMFKKRKLSKLQYFAFYQMSLSILNDDGLSCSDVADKFGLTRQNFNRAYNVARDKVREYLMECYPDIINGGN